MDHREWTIDEIAARTGLLRMTAYRMVRTLEAAEFLVRDSTTNTYHLGPAAIAMSYVAEDNSDFVELARPFLERLVETTGESVTLAIPVDGSPVCVSIIDSTPPVPARDRAGRIIGDLASVHGKIFTAFAPPERRAEVLARPRRKHTPYTVTDPEALPERARARRRGGRGLRRARASSSASASVGCPVRDQLGNVVAALSVVMPAGRFGPRRARPLHAGRQGRRASLSAYLGWNPSRPASGLNRLSPSRRTSTVAKGQRLR